ncbi:MAG: DMT family transporter, partial [Verrucomicrobiota bacterium]
MKAPSNTAISAGLLFAVVLWGANNTGTKYLIHFWPPGLVGCARFTIAGIILLALLRWTKWFGPSGKTPQELNGPLWWRGGLTLATYTLVMNWALVTAPISHVAVYLGASPIWALIWEGWPERSWKSAQRYLAAALALAGVFILFLPAWKGSSPQLVGEILGLTSSVLWTNYGRQCRVFAQRLSGAEVAAQTFWRAGILLLPFAIFEIAQSPPVLRWNLVGIQLFCAIGGGVVAYALWNGALRHWKVGQVYLFNNLIPLSTVSWAYLLLSEKITPTFWVATLLIIAGVLFG